MPRLFVALEPPAAVKDALVDLMEGVAGARWQDEEQLHLTLRFVGEVDRHAAADLDAALAGVRHPAVGVTLAGAGVFGKPGRPHTLWIGAGPLAPLRALHGKVDGAAVRAGLAPETRAYAPHVTLARLGAGVGPLGGMIARIAGLAPLAFVAEEFTLVQSLLGRGGARYERVAAYRLG